MKTGSPHTGLWSRASRPNMEYERRRAQTNDDGIAEANEGDTSDPGLVLDPPYLR